MESDYYKQKHSVDQYIEMAKDVDGTAPLPLFLLIVLYCVSHVNNDLKNTTYVTI